MSEEKIEVQNKIAGSLMKTLIGVACGLLVCVGIAQAKATVTWGMWGSPAEIKTHQRVADAFMASHPDIAALGRLLYQAQDSLGGRGQGRHTRCAVPITGGDLCGTGCA